MSDVVVELRTVVPIHAGGGDFYPRERVEPLLRRAADEIERLRSAAAKNDNPA